MKKIIFLLILGLLFFRPVISYALTIEEQLQAKQKEIEELENKVSELQKQEKTLSSQLAYMNNQIKLTTLKISQTEEEIVSLTGKISRLEVSLDYMAQILSKRIAETYKRGKVEPITLFFSSSGFSDFVNRFKYLRVAQLNDKKLLLAMEETRTNYDEQKTAVSELKKKMETQKSLLDKQKKDKEFLLSSTKSDERKFKDMLATARAEQAAIEHILAGQGNDAKVGPVNQGESIGSYILGVSACSSGTHLHFEVAKGGSLQNPANYLKNISLLYESNVAHFTPGGSFDWPIFEPVRITQEFGDTFWSRLGWYGGKPHTGIDMVSGTFGSPGPRTIKSVKEGTLFRGSIACGGGMLRYARVDHTDGLTTYYLHVN